MLGFRVNRRIRIGVIGAGRVGQIAHIAQYAGMPDLDVAIADLRPQLAAEAAAAFGVAEVFADHHALLQSGVDAVVVVVRRQATGPIVLDAIRAGVDVLSEKPMALTLNAATMLCDAARASGTRYGVAYMKRYDAGLNVARRYARSNRAELGAVRGVVAWSAGGESGAAADAFAMTGEPRPDGLETWGVAPVWLPVEWQLAYEQTLNVHSHVTNAVTYLVGERLEVECADYDGAVIRCNARAGDIPVRFEFRENPPDVTWSEGIHVQLARGALEIVFPAPFAQHAGAVVRVSRAGSATTLHDGGGPGAWSSQAVGFAQWVRGARAFASPAADALGDVAFFDRLWSLLARARYAGCSNA